MRFERDLLEYSLAVLNEDKEQADTLKEGIVEQISELPLSVSFVKQEETLIRAAQTSHYWAKDTVYRWRERKGLPAHRVGRLWKFQVSEVDDWVRAGGADEHKDQVQGE
jgi:excisionase family DNA binding protein